MKKIKIPALLVIATLVAMTASASNNWHRGFERGGYNRAVETRGYTNNFNRVAYVNNYNRGYYYNQPRVVYNPRPVAYYGGYQYGPRRIGYYFYPGVNVYFNPFNHLYIYPFRGTWVTAAVLPRGFVINEPYRQVYCGVGENIWAYNNVHINTYRRGPVVVNRGYRPEMYHGREEFRGRR